MHGVAQEMVSQQDEIRDKVYDYIVENLLLGAADDLDESASLLDAGILDSTGAMELVAFLEQEFGIRITDTEIIADNLDSIDRICALVSRKRAGSRQEA